MAKVYIKTNENNEVIEINSDIFLDDLTDYIEVDEGEGDKYSHCQNNYLDKPLMDDYGRYNYKYEDGIVEIEDKTPILSPTPTPTTEERLEALESAVLEMVLGGTE